MEGILRRYVPLLVVAVFALVAAVAGSALGGSGVVTPKTAKKIAAQQINKLAPGLSVASAETAKNATNAGNATNAANAANAANADNAAKADGADICSGTVSMQSTGSQTLCSVGVLSVVANCLISGAETRSRVDLVSSGAAWAFGETIDAPAAVSTIAELSLSSPFTIAEGADNNNNPGVVDGAGAWVSAGTTGGSSISGQFSVRANLTATNVGTCHVTSGAIAR